jgi:hypothetical protein
MFLLRSVAVAKTSRGVPGDADRRRSVGARLPGDSRSKVHAAAPRMSGITGPSRPLRRSSLSGGTCFA